MASVSKHCTLLISLVFLSTASNFFSEPQAVGVNLCSKADYPASCLSSCVVRQTRQSQPGRWFAGWSWRPRTRRSICRGSVLRNPNWSKFAKRTTTPHRQPPHLHGHPQEPRQGRALTATCMGLWPSTWTRSWNGRRILVCTWRHWFTEKLEK